VESPETFAGHSPRRGATADALDGGISWELVKKMGRWKSDAFWEHYVTMTPAMLKCFARLGVQKPQQAMSL